MAGYDYKDLDDVIHGRVRLAIMAFLSTAGRAEFGHLKDRLDASDGNLSTHLRKLEDAGYVTLDKRFENRRPLTTVILTEAGRDAFAAYVSRLEGLLGLGDA